MIKIGIATFLRLVVTLSGQLALTPASYAAPVSDTNAGPASRSQTVPPDSGQTRAAPLDAAEWSVTAEGQTLLRGFHNAPYPHASRAQGYTYQGRLFDAATHYNDGTVGIFIPAGYQAGETVDYVVHFHGWGNHVANVLDHYALRRQMNASGRNAILLVPQGPKDATDSGGGRLELEPGAFETLIGEVTQYLRQSGKIHAARIGRIVLSTHSGGYRVTGAILAQGGLTDHITDVLLFDSSYGSLESFADWAAQSPHSKQDNKQDRRLVSLFTDHLAPENFTLLTLLQKRHVAFHSLLESDLNAAILAPRQAVFLHTPTLPHDEVMQQKNYFALFLQTSALPSIVQTENHIPEKHAL